MLVLASSGWFSAGAEATANSDYAAAEKAAKEGEAAVALLRAAMQQADAAVADASKAANTKRQQATDAKNLAGEPGVKALQQAEANVAAAIKAVTDATNASAATDKVLADAKAAALPLEQAYAGADKAAREAEIGAKAASAAANNLDAEAKRKAAVDAAAALAQARQGEEQAQAQANAAVKALTDAAEAYKQSEKAAPDQVAVARQKLAETAAQMRPADDALANARNKVAAATTAAAAAEQAARDAVKFAEEKKQAAVQAAAKRQAAGAAAAALAQAQQKQHEAQNQASAAAQKFAEAAAQKKSADETLENLKQRIASAKQTQEADEKTAKEAEAALAPRQAVAEKARVAYLAAKNLADDQRGLANQVKAAADYAAAEKTAKEAEAALGPLRASMQQADKAYADGSAVAQTKRQQANDAKNLAGEPGAKELKQAEDNVPAAVEALTKATDAKPALDKALAEAKAAAQPLQQAYDAAEKAAKGAEAAARVATEAANKLDDEAKKAAAQAAAVRRAADTAKAALVRAQQSEPQATAQANAAPQKVAEAEAQKQAAQQGPQKAADAAAQKLARATAQKKLADTTLANVKNQIAAATTNSEFAEQAARAAAKLSEAKAQAVAQAAAQRKAVADAAAALAQVQLRANATNEVAAAAAALQAAQQAGQEVVRLDTASKEASAQAAAKRKTANEAKAALDPKAQALEQAAIRANETAQALDRAQQRKKSAEEALDNLKKRIASAKQTHEADEKAAQQAEAAAVPLKAEAEKTRAAYLAARDLADHQRTAAEQAKAALYRLVAARQVASLTESPEPPKPANRIDELLFAKLKSLGIDPVLCSDAVFLRRAYLDLTGKLPSAEEAKTFVQDPDKNKRAGLIDRLLDRPEHADYWAMKWSDILRVKAEFPVKIWPNAAQAYHRWLWEAVAQNKPYDQFARELLTSSGSNFRVGAVNFYRAIQNRTPEGISGVVALAFMGTRVHVWPADRRAGMAAFFSQVGYKPTSEWKEEIVFWDPLHSTSVPGDTAPGVDAIDKAVKASNLIPQALVEPLSQNGPLAAVFPDGAKLTIPTNRDPREVFAEWLIRPANPWFARAIANRTWTWAMGRGIIHEPDDIREDNPPSNPELLAYLEQELVSSGYNLKHLKRLIFTSTAYQFSSTPRFKGPEARANFASYLMRRLEAEVLIDALNEITGSSDLYTSAVPEPFTYIPHDISAVALADGSVTSSFLSLFGRSSRSTGMETERVNDLASTQWLHLLNSATIQNKLQSGPKLAAKSNGRVVGEQRSSGDRGGGQMIFILAIDHVRFGSRQHVDAARPQAKHEGSSHGDFVEIEPKLTHRRVRLGPEIVFPVERGGLLLTEIRLDLIPVDVIIGQGRVDLGQAQVRVLQGNFVGSHAHFVPTRDSADGQSGAGNLRPSTANPRIAVDQSSDLGNRRHTHSLSHRLPNCLPCSLRLRMRQAPLRIAVQHLLGHGVVPAIPHAPLAREFLHVVVNALVPVRENGTVRSDLVEPRPDRLPAAGRSEPPSVRTAPVRLIADRGLLKPGGSRVNGAGHRRARFGQTHEKQ